MRRRALLAALALPFAAPAIVAAQDTSAARRDSLLPDSGNRVDRWLLGDRATALRLLPGASGDRRFAVDVSW